VELFFAVDGDKLEVIDLKQVGIHCLGSQMPEQKDEKAAGGKQAGGKGKEVKAPPPPPPPPPTPLEVSASFRAIFYPAGHTRPFNRGRAAASPSAPPPPHPAGPLMPPPPLSPLQVFHTNLRLIDKYEGTRDVLHVLRVMRYTRHLCLHLPRSHMLSAIDTYISSAESKSKLLALLGGLSQSGGGVRAPSFHAPPS